MIHFSYWRQQLGAETLGQCSNFKAVPGYGLTCTVSGIDHLLAEHSTMVEDKNRRNVVVKVEKVVVDETSDEFVDVRSGAGTGTLHMLDTRAWLFKGRLELILV